MISCYSDKEYILNHGIYSSTLDNDFYQDPEKKLRVELQGYHKYWYDLIVHPNEVATYFDSKELIVDYLSRLNKSIKESLNKRCVYFICSRTKVRFNTNKKPFYNPITKKVKIHILVGRSKKQQTFKCQFFDIPSNKFCNPNLDITDKYITVKDSKGNLVTSSIHDLLEQSNINLGLSSMVKYVGYNKTPDTESTHSTQTALSNALTKIVNEDFDTFIYFNAFKVTTRAVSNQIKLNIIISNALTDALEIELEDKLIENCFTFYFNALNQNIDKEMKELKSSLDKIDKENNIKKVSFIYEFEEENEYGVFSSPKVPASVNHTFNVIKHENKVQIQSDLTCFETSL